MKKYINKTMVALDIETTGLDPKNGEIIELAAVKFKGDKIIKKYQSLVNPDVEIPRIVSAITGINDDDVKKSPRINELINEFNNFVGEYPIIGHNINFDINFLNNKGFHFKNAKYDTWKLAALLVPNLSSHSLESLAEFFKIKHIESHRALDDVLASIELFNILVRKIYELDINTLKDVVSLLKNNDWHLSDVFKYIYKKRPKKEKKAEEKSKSAPRKKKILKNIKSIDKIFEDKLEVKKYFKKYEYRSEQVKLMRELLNNFEKESNAYITIAPGVGKELAYLAASVYYSKNFDKNVFVAVEHYAKIEEMTDKQLIKLQKIFPFDFNYSILLHRSAYICLRRFNVYRNQEKFNQSEMNTLVKLLLWLPTTNTGIFAETARLYEDQEMENQVNCKEEYCTKSKCEYYQECYYYKALKQAQKTDIVFGDHSSLISHFIDSKVAPIKSIVLERAYKLEESYENYHLIKINDDLISTQLKNLDKQLNYLDKMLSNNRKDEKIKVLIERLESEAGKIKNKTSLYFGILGIFINKQDSSYGFKQILINKYRTNLDGWDQVAQSSNNMILQLNNLIFQVNNIIKLISSKKFSNIKSELEGISHDFYNIVNKIQKLLLETNKNTVIWLEENFGKIEIIVTSNGIKEGVIDNLLNNSNSANILNTAYESEKINDLLINRLKISQRIQQVPILKKEEHEKYLKIIVPTDIPSPNHSNFNNAVSNIILNTAKKIKGGVVVSLPSRAAINNIYENIAIKLKKINIKVHAQGVSGGKEKVFNQFLSDKNTVLLASHQLIIDKDFPTGDIKCLVLVKFPFDMVSHPQLKAKYGDIRGSFMDKVLPAAVFKYMKIFQKIAKNRDTKGVFVNLDSRLNSANYGDDFIKAIPDIGIEYTEIDNIDEEVYGWLKNKD